MKISGEKTYFLVSRIGTTHEIRPSMQGSLKKSKLYCNDMNSKYSTLAPFKIYKKLAVWSEIK